MEKLQNLKHCPWVSEEISLSEFKKEHLEPLQSMFQRHPSKDGWQNACKLFFEANVSENLDNEVATRSAVERLYDKDQLEQDCGIDQLTCPNELPASDTLDEQSALSGKLPTNWFQGSFGDSVIPNGGGERLLTLYHQAQELHKRATVGDYATLRFRTLHYFTTVRLPQQVNTSPLPTDLPDDIVVNVRIQRPYFKKTHYKKSSDKYPAHSQELLLLGSQPLTDLRDVIECVNDFAVHKDMVDCPQLDLVDSHPAAKEQFPSGMFYINGVFYVDQRQRGCKDYSQGIYKWAAKLAEIGPLVTRSMKHTLFQDLRLRLGYPYLYLHQGYCEHLLTFTDIRLREPSDPAGASHFPISRGHSSKLSTRCCACNRNLAVWLVVDCPLLHSPQAHMCDSCLKSFCYDRKSKPRGKFSVYPFYDEGTVQIKLLKRKREDDDGDAEESKQAVVDTDEKEQNKENRISFVIKQDEPHDIDDVLIKYDDTAELFQDDDLVS